MPAGAVAGVELVEPERIRTTLSGSLLLPRDDQQVETQPRSLPLVRLDEAFGAPDQADGFDSPAAGPVQVLAYQADGARGAIAVDRIRDRREVVVKPLGPPLERLRKYSGAALLDDGSVALILDLVNLARV